MGRMASLLLCIAAVIGTTRLAFADEAAEKAAQEKARKAALQARRRMELVQNDAAIQQFEQQFAPQFRQLYRTELHFMRLVAQPTKQQYEKISADGEPVLKATIKKFAVHMRGGPGEQSDPRTPIADALAKSVQAALSPEQAARYQKELDQRAAARKRVVLLNLVAKVDKVLVLSIEQRDKLGKILDNKWTDSWDQTQMLMYVGQHFPPMPDTEILPILTESQKVVWRGIPKGNIRFGFNLGFVQGIEIEEEVWDDDPPKQNPERADGKAPVKDKGTPKPLEKK